MRLHHFGHLWAAPPPGAGASASFGGPVQPPPAAGRCAVAPAALGACPTAGQDPQTGGELPELWFSLLLHFHHLVDSLEKLFITEIMKQSSLRMKESWALACGSMVRALTRPHMHFEAVLLTA